MNRDESEFLEHGCKTVVESPGMRQCSDISYLSIFENKRAPDRSFSEPFRVGETVRAKPGTNLYRFLEDYYQDPGVALKIERASVFGESSAYDYLVIPKTTVRESWVQNMPIPAMHEDLYLQESLRSTGIVSTLDRVRPDRGYFKFLESPNGIRADDQYSVSARFPDAVEVCGRQHGEIARISLEGAGQYTIEIMENTRQPIARETHYLLNEQIHSNQVSWADQMEKKLSTISEGIDDEFEQSALAIYYPGEFDQDLERALVQRVIDALGELGIELNNPRVVDHGPDHPGEPASTWIANPEFGNYVQIVDNNIDAIPDDFELRTPEFEVFKDGALD